MITKILLVLCLITIIFTLCCGGRDNNIYNINAKFEKIISELSNEKIWNNRDAYDMSHYLMIPMIYVYSSGDSKRVYFEKIFKSLNEKFGEVLSLDRLTKLQFLYFVSQYLVLKFQIIGLNLWEINLAKKVEDEMLNIYLSGAWQWRVCGIDKFQNMRERIVWKLKTKDVIKSYCRAIIDEEMFTIGIAANLKIIGLENPHTDEILDLAYQIFSQEIVWKNDTWLFQPGVWEDHPDYKYACYESLPLPQNPQKCKGIVSDTSHFHRIPLILLSLQLASRSYNEYEFYLNLRKTLMKHFLKNILVYPVENIDYFRTKNFMDGRNGFYRVGYPTVPEGYGPYELSTTFLLGWWSLLPGDKINSVYCDILNNIPFSEEAIRFYSAKETSRERHPLIKGLNKFKSGFIYYIIYSACNLMDYKAKMHYNNN